MSRPPKKYRAPVSIFDMPCPPTAAPPRDSDDFFSHLDSVQETLEEEDLGRIPKSLETGPQIVVESLNKRRRTIRPEERHALSQEYNGSSQSEQLRKRVQFNLKLNQVHRVPRVPRESRTPAIIISAVPADLVPKKLRSVRSPSPPRKASNKAEPVVDDDDDHDEQQQEEEEDDQGLEIAHPIEDWHSPPDSPSPDNCTAEDPPVLHTGSSMAAAAAALEERPNLTVAPASFAKPHDIAQDAPSSSTTLLGNSDHSMSGTSGEHSGASNTSSSTTFASSSSGAASAPSSTLATTTTRSRKGKEPVRSVASLIGSRRKQPAAPIRIPSLQRTPSVIAIDDENDDVDLFHKDARRATTTTIESNSSSSSTSSSPTKTTGSSGSGHVPEGSHTIAETHDSPPGSKPAAAVATNLSPLAGLYIYVLPQNMTTMVFDGMRKRVIELKGHWVGPKTKALALDPRTKQELPALDQEQTTHIVTELTSLQAVMQHLNVKEINPKITVVSREWLQDTITYKRVMDPENYTLSRPEIVLPAQPLEQETPPSTQIRQPLESRSDQTSKGSEHQLDFNEILQGIQEGSLEEDAEMSDPEEGVDGPKDGDDDAKTETGEASSPTGSKDEELCRVLGLTPQVLETLRLENRCFKCRQEGHWMNRCPKRPLEKDKEEALLEIINSGKAEAKRRKLYKCQSPHVAGQKDEPRYNKAIIEQLKILMDHYDKTKHQGSTEHFKVINYRKAITAIRALDYEITSEEMALQVPRVGKGIAQKIGECIALGKIKKLDHLDWDKDRSKVETLFRNIYGVGAEKATEWYNKGLRTLDDVRQLPDLNKNQISGLKYYHDLLKRIPRAEVEQIAKVVEDAAKDLHSDIQCQVTGSYRRGKADCGDIDIVVTRPNVDNGDELFMIMQFVLDGLEKSGFLVENLAVPSWSDDMSNQPKHFKYMGICRLAGESSLHRRIDILVAPWMHLGAVLLYFTGNDICNRSMRLLARKRNMRLSDKGLFVGVIRGKNGKKMNEGEWIAGRTEREIFERLGIDYLEPYEREC
ncbi:hypothetical protein BGX31_010609 [Mortierella sp. GBA43]|nr:hypothetical protein BGX31_010609 [Mortierella sp. GBA43]